jgi:hypothetical protein
MLIYKANQIDTNFLISQGVIDSNMELTNKKLTLNFYISNEDKRRWISNSLSSVDIFLNDTYFARDYCLKNEELSLKYENILSATFEVEYSSYKKEKDRQKKMSPWALKLQKKMKLCPVSINHVYENWTCHHTGRKICAITLDGFLYFKFLVDEKNLKFTLFREGLIQEKESSIKEFEKYFPEGDTISFDQLIEFVSEPKFNWGQNVN